MGKLYIVSGDDDIGRKRRARELVCEILSCDEPENDPSFEVISGDADDSLDQIASRFLDALRTPPFLADQKVLWLRHFPDLEKISADSASKLFAAIAEELSQVLPDELTVVVDGPNFDQRKSFAKKVKSTGAVIENRASAKAGDRNFAENRRMEILNWSKKSGKYIEPDAVQYITEAVPGTSSALANELEKLDCYTGNRPQITLADCREVISRTPEAIAWEFTAAITSRNRRAALKLLNDLIAQGEPEIRLLAMLSGEFQKMMQTRIAMAQLGINGRVNARTFDNIPEDVRAANTGNFLLKLHPFRAFKICEGTAAVTGEELADKLSAIRDASRRLVSGGGNSRIILEQLALKLTSR